MSDNPDKIYFYRILDMVINVGTECLLLVFYKLKPRDTVASFFSSLTTQFSDLKSKGFLKDFQYQLVTASNPDPDKFDITLLSCLLTNVFPGKINKPPSGWNPSSTDTSLSADLIRMRSLRNEIAHRGHAKMTKDEFNKQFTYVEKILIRIANSVGTDVEIDIHKKIFQIKTKEEYEDRVIAALMSTWEEWKSYLETIQANTIETNKVIKTLDHKMDNLSATVQALVKDKSVHGTDDKTVLSNLYAAMAEGHAPDRMLTDKNLLDISNNIGNGWESLAVDLKIPLAQIDHFKTDHKSMQQQIYNMLLKWRNTEGCNATWISLLDKMINVPGLTVDLNALVKIFDVPQTRRDHIQQARSLVSMDITQVGHIQAPITSVPQVSLTVESLSAEEWKKIVKMLQCDCISYYRKIFSKLQLSPLIEEDEYAAHFFDVYVKPNITIVSHQELKGQSESRCVTFHDIFSFKPCSNIYISSPAGCGKTSFAKYLTLIWCQAHQPIRSDSKRLLKKDVNEMKNFTFLFIVFLRDSHESECDVDIMIQNQLLPNLSKSNTYTKLGLDFLQKLLSSVKCIIVLDGLDEWSHPTGNTCVLKNKHIPHSRARPMCTTLTTSRPWKLDVVGLKPGEIDQKLEINGLDNDLFKRLIDNVVTKMNKVQGKKMQADAFERVLEYNNLTDLSKIPVVLMQLLTVWFDNVPLGESQCEIYSNMIEFLLKHYCNKRGIVSEMEDMEIDDCNRDRQIPKCLQNNMYCKVHMELLTKVATLAYNTLFTDNEETSLVFDRRIAKKYLSDPEIEMSLAVGILTQEKVLGKMSMRQSHISFIHKTFQEYLAALYVALSPGTGTNVEEKIKHVCCSIEKILEMSQIFMFLSGLCPEVMVNLGEHLRQTVSEDRRTRRYRETLELGLWGSTEGRTLNQVHNTMVKCLDECWLNGHKHVTHLPVWDFFIRNSQWSDVLKSLVVHNPVCTLYVDGDDFSPEKIEDILNSVTVFNSIQKLWLYRVSETFVVQLVSQHKHSLSVRPETWRHLGWVTLDSVKMPGDILCSFVDSILPKSVQVRLKCCTISQGTKDWKTYIRSHPRLTVDKDVDRVVNDWLIWNVRLLQFHTNKVQTFSTV